MYHINRLALLSICFITMQACNNGPKVIAPSIQVTDNPSNSDNNEFHKVLVNEVLPAERYVYLNVSEGDLKYWIATRKQEIKKGENYFYKGGLLKTNFESKEYNKVFDTIYLISNLVSQDHSERTVNLNTSVKKSEPITQKEDIPTHTDKIIEHKGSIKIAELVKDPKKYEGHTIQISGKCIKTNPNIMGLNWIHIQDGSKDDFDLIVTSNTHVPEGKTVTFRAIVTLNKDFGAGYKFDLILENGTLVE